MFRKVLVANRGEIAVRVMRTLREMGIATVAVYSEADRHALHVQMADEAWCVGPAPSRESYLRMDRILEVARESGAEAIHPGYGFLSENVAFAEACREAGVVFIGPPVAAIEAMGEKTRARRAMMAAGVPVVPGTEYPIETAAEALVIARGIGFPVLIKAAAGGGGKGMRSVFEEDAFLAAFEGAQREAASAFGDASCYVEKLIVRPKHVEIQVLADTLGGCVHLFERDCSVQRRHQKVIEESPCPVLPDAVRQRMGEVAVQGARAVDYVGAGTFEFLLDARGDFYFLEMNTRLQVEHPVTEMVTGVDLVREQVRIAYGLPMSVTQETLAQRGHAIEVRVYAEDPAANFLPAPGVITHLQAPQGLGVRVDSGFVSGSEVSLHYDPMVAKLIVHAPDREQARHRMLHALEAYRVHGITTNIDHVLACLRWEAFVRGDYDTGMIGTMPPWTAREVEPLDRALAALMSAVSGEGQGTARSAATGPAGDDQGAWRRLGRWNAVQSGWGGGA
jgi:acetyl-CoA carboxylase biotin carboxylase subunit